MLPNCASTYSDPCQAEVDCTGGNDADVDACVEASRGSEEIASAYDCSEPFDKYVDCLKEKSTCKDSGGTKRYTDDNQCGALKEAVESCQKAASARGK
jgi:hypothetical protein